MKSKKSFFDFEKNDKNKSFDDDKLNANDKSNANENNSFDDMNEDENQSDFAKSFQKKENAMTKIVRSESKKSESENDWDEFFDF